MRHKVGYRKLNRPSDHRMAMLRNIVSSLIEHQQIMTTYAKAKAAQRFADKMVTLAKKGTQRQWDMANAFLFHTKEKTLTPLFNELAERYKDRPGGYTRIRKAGYRQGDSAELAVLEFVDNPNDLKYEFAARAVGRDMAIEATKGGAGRSAWSKFSTPVLSKGVDAIESLPWLHELTKRNIKKALTYKPGVSSFQGPSETKTTNQEATPEADESAPAAPAVPSGLNAFVERARHHYLRSLASFRLGTAPAPNPEKTARVLTARLRPRDGDSPPRPNLIVPQVGRMPRAGQRIDGWAQDKGTSQKKSVGPLTIAKGDNARGPKQRYM